MTVQTLRGPVPATALGPTLMHEHVFTLYRDLGQEYAHDDTAQDAAAVTALRDLTTTGFTTIVDLTVLGLGRDVARIARLSRAADLHIVCATGIYTFADLPAYFKNGTAYLRENFISDFFVRELTDGVADTGIRPALIKVAVDARGVTEDLDLLLRQSALAHTRTGAPISTHTHASSRQGLVQQRILREEGVDLTRVVIGHCGDSTDLDYLEQLIEAGSWLGMDRFGHEPSGRLADRIDTLAALCERGYAERMVLSHDTNVASDNVPPQMRALPQFEHWHYRCVPDIVLPALRQRGVSERDIRLMTIDNPVAILDSN
jgi:phosphotriesterase-related protein